MFSVVNVQWQNDLGQTLLHLAAGGRLEAVECLVKAGAAIHLTDSAGLTPLMVAVMGAENMESEELAVSLVRMLAEGDTRLDLPDPQAGLEHGQTAL